MRPKLQRRIQRQGWDRASAFYERYWQEQLRPAHEALLAAADLQPGEHVLDVACGTGLVTLPAAARVAPGGRVVGTDISSSMVTSARSLATERGLTNAAFECCAAEDLEVVATTTFDVALCSLGLMYVPEPAVALAEMHRLLRPGGRVVASVWGERSCCGWAEVFPIVDARVASDVCPLFFALGAPGALAGVMTCAGFVEVEVTRLDVELVYADEDEAIGAAFLGGPVALAHSRFDDDTRRSAHAEYIDSLHGFRDGAGFRVPGQFAVASARRPPADPHSPHQQDNQRERHTS